MSSLITGGSRRATLVSRISPRGDASPNFQKEDSNLERKLLFMLHSFETRTLSDPQSDSSCVNDRPILHLPIDAQPLSYGEADHPPPIA